MRLELTEDQSWALISIGLILIGIAMIGFAWATWPEGFIGLMTTIWDLLTSLLDMA